ncbi:MAG: helix-turn-helix domain-containing protein, partial [Candidatus Dormibacteria bacterium]
RVGRSTLDEWIRAWRAGGFEALVPKPRRSQLRTDPELLAVAERLKREAPKRTSEQVARVMAEAGDLGSTELRSLDAVHLAAALSIGSDMGALFTYDSRLREAAIAQGLDVLSPS